MGAEINDQTDTLEQSRSLLSMANSDEMSGLNIFKSKSSSGISKLI